MKYLLIPLTFVAASAIACPADGSKDAAAPTQWQPMAAAKAAPVTSKAAVKTVGAKSATKVAEKVSPEQRKVARL